MKFVVDDDDDNHSPQQVFPIVSADNCPYSSHVYPKINPTAVHDFCHTTIPIPCSFLPSSLEFSDGNIWLAFVH